jgi:ribosomal protein S12 methylthiotransferase accessory factor
MSTNGLASGNTFAEAIVHAACELIERDAKVMWHDDPSDPDGKAAQLDLSTVADPTCRELISRLEMAGLHFAAYDITSDVGVPAFAAVIADPTVEARGIGYAWGYGCHLAPEVALTRALTEAAQSRLTVISGSRDDLCESYERRGDRDSSEIARLIQEPPPTRRFERSSLAGRSPRDDVRTIVRRLRAAGIRSLVAVDLSHADVGIPVVKLLATQLELEHGDCARNVRARERYGMEVPA